MHSVRCNRSQHAVALVAGAALALGLCLGLDRSATSRSTPFKVTPPVSQAGPACAVAVGAEGLAGVLLATAFRLSGPVLGWVSLRRGYAVRRAAPRFCRAASRASPW